MKKNYTLTNIFIFCLIFSLSLALGGCSFKNPPQKTTLSFSSWGSQSEMSTLEPLLKEFEKQNPDIKIKFIHIPKNYFQKLHLLIASNLTPDVMFINNINSKVYVKNNILEDLNPYLKEDKQISKKDFFENSLKAFENNDALYAVPRDVSNIVVYYNKDIFNKYKVPYPEQNWNFQDFLNTARLLTKDTNNDGKTDIFGTSFEENSLFWLPFLWSNGSGLISENLKNVIITTPQSKKTLSFYIDLRNKWHVAPSAEEQGSATMAQMFIQNRIAMHISGRWSTPAYRKTAGLNWDVAAFPRGTSGSIVDADASGWAISKTSKNKTAAWKLIKFFASQKSSENFTTGGLIIPARKDVAYSKYFLRKTEKPKNSKVFVDIIKTSIPTPSNENYQEITDIINQELEPAFRGKAPLGNILNNKLEQKIKKLLNGNNNN
jgi:multiple sugar transport system substrate-binding protein